MTLPLQEIPGRSLPLTPGDRPLEREPLRLPSVVSAPRVRCDTGRDALRELESTARLLEQIDDVLGPLGITDVFRLRIRERIGSIRITLKREWQRRAGGKTGDES